MKHILMLCSSIRKSHCGASNSPATKHKHTESITVKYTKTINKAITSPAVQEILFFQEDPQGPVEKERDGIRAKTVPCSVHEGRSRFAEGSKPFSYCGSFSHGFCLIGSIG